MDSLTDRIIWMMMPGGHSAMVRKAVKYLPDVIIPCLEDGVAYSDASKERARQSLRMDVEHHKSSDAAFLVAPRINHPSGPYWEADASALIDAGVDGLVIPKCESGAEVQSVAQFVRDRQNGSDTDNPPFIIAMIETTKGLVQLEEIADSDPLLGGILFGREDFSASIGLLRRHQESLVEGSPELLYARSRVATIASAYGLASIDGASFTFKHEDYMVRDAGLSARIGYTGKLAAHPAHVAAIAKGFAPTPDVVDASERIVALDEEANRSGDAALGEVEGMEVTPPIVDQARLVLRRKEWADSRTQ